MKTILILSLVVAVFSCFCLAKPQETYNLKYESFNAEDVVENTRLLKAYGKCFLDKGPCTAEGTDFKKVIPEALKTSCGKCTRKQRQLVRTVVRGFQNKTPDLWEQLVLKEDPEGAYKESFDHFLNSDD